MWNIAARTDSTSSSCCADSPMSVSCVENVCQWCTGDPCGMEGCADALLLLLLVECIAFNAVVDSMLAQQSISSTHANKEIVTEKQRG